MVACSQQRRVVVRVARPLVSRVLIASAAAIAMVSAAGFAKGAPTPAQGSLAKSASVRDLVSCVNGEWEGSVQVHAASASKDARNSASVVGLSASVSNATCSAVFAGAAFGKPFDGAMIWNANDNSATWVVGDSGQAVHGSLVASAPGVLTFASEPEPVASDTKDAPAQTSRFEQVVRLDQEGRVKIELARVVKSAQGERRECIASFDVVKLPAGEPSLASGLASSSPQLALAQASVNQGPINASGNAAGNRATASAE